MFEQLNKQVIDLRECLQRKDVLTEHENETLEQLHQDLHDYVLGGTQKKDEHEDLTERVNLAYEKVEEKHPDLAAIFQRLKQILQNMGL